MRKAISIALILVLLYPLGMKAFLITAFHLQQDRIVRMHCENRDRPEKKCNGSCYIQKQLAKTEQGQSAPSKVMEKQEVEDFLVPEEWVGEQAEVAVIHEKPIGQLFSLFDGRELFRPPCSVSS